jgi:exosome complex component CSL4
MNSASSAPATIFSYHKHMFSYYVIRHRSDAMPMPTTASPGLALGPAFKYASGSGTYVESGTIYASIAGTVSTSKQATTSGPSQVLSISTAPPATTAVPSRNVAQGNILPKVNSVVLAKVTRLGARQINVAILVVDDIVCADAFAGVVRKEDVRGWEVDKVVLGECFRVGDVIRAVVVSHSESTNTYHC